MVEVGRIVFENDRFEEWSNRIDKMLENLGKDISLLGISLKLEKSLNELVGVLNSNGNPILGTYERVMNFKGGEYSINERRTGILLAELKIKDDCRLYGKVYPEQIKDVNLIKKILEFFGENQITIDSYKP